MTRHTQANNSIALSQRLLEFQLGELQFRLLQPDDEALFTDIYTNPELMRHTGLLMPLAQAKHAFQRTLKIINKTIRSSRPRYLAYSVCHLDTKTVFGLIALTNINHCQRAAEIGLILLPSAQGTGYSAPSLEALLSFGFKELKLQTIVAQVKKSNIPALKLVQRLDFYLCKHESASDLDTDTLVYLKTRETI